MDAHHSYFFPWVHGGLLPWRGVLPREEAVGILAPRRITLLIDDDGLQCSKSVRRNSGGRNGMPISSVLLRLIFVLPSCDPGGGVDAIMVGSKDGSCGSHCTCCVGFWFRIF